MLPTAKLRVDTSPMKNAKKVLQEWDVIVSETGVDVANEIVPPFLSELERYPARAKHPIEWTSERQRKFVMAKLRAEGNLPYQRTGGLAQSWQVTDQTQGGRFTLTVRNLWAGAVYVMGAINFRSLADAARMRQKMHANTGWQLAQVTVSYWFGQARTMFADKLRERAGKRWKFKSTRRNR